MLCEVIYDPPHSGQSTLVSVSFYDYLSDGTQIAYDSPQTRLGDPNTLEEIGPSSLTKQQNSMMYMFRVLKTEMNLARLY